MDVGKSWVLFRHTFKIEFRSSSSLKWLNNDLHWKKKTKCFVAKDVNVKGYIHYEP